MKAAAKAGLDVRIEIRPDAIVATTLGKAEGDLDRDLAELEARLDNATAPKAQRADRTNGRTRHLPSRTE